jgi:hypothetical protein
MARQTGHRLLKKNFVVLGDGLTEQFYLKHLKEIKKYKYSIRPSLFTNINFESAERIIDELLSGGCDQIIYFCDYDTIVNQDSISDFEKLFNKYKSNETVLICKTMPSIEFWFLLHFIKTTREFANSKEVKNQLSKYILGYSKKKKFLSYSNWVEKLCKSERMEKAITSAEEILIEKKKKKASNHFPFTEVHLGIEKFEQQK